MKKTIIILLLIILSNSLVAQFGGAKQDSKKEKKVLKSSFIQKFNSKIQTMQMKYRGKMSEFVRQIKKEKKNSLIFLVIFFSFLYGVLHSMGPGHGKIITSSYFISEKAKISKGILAGFSFAFIHAISGLLLVVILNLVLKAGKLQKSALISDHIQTFSFIIITILGFVLLIKHIRELKTRKFHSHNTKSLIVLILSLGLIPCPGSVIIALFSLNVQMFSLGIIMVFSMAIGMGVTISLVGLISISIRKLSENLNSKFFHVSEIISPIFGIFGSLMLICFGLLFM